MRTLLACAEHWHKSLRATDSKRLAVLVKSCFTAQRMNFDNFCGLLGMPRLFHPWLWNAAFEAFPSSLFPSSYIILRGNFWWRILGRNEHFSRTRFLTRRSYFTISLSCVLFHDSSFVSSRLRILFYFRVLLNTSSRILFFSNYTSR